MEDRVVPNEDAKLTQLRLELHRTISRERLETYREPGASDLAMITTYYWNLALSEALYSVIAIFEVAFRNSVHLALSAKYGTTA
jgi:hypothetical protein